MNPVKALQKHGQAVWLDFLARGFVAKGDLKKLIDEDGVRGVTSNPAIFEKAIGSSDEYDGAIAKALKQADRPVTALFESLAVEDIQHAADVLRPVYNELKGADGFVSPEVQKAMHEGLDDHPKVTLHDYPGADHGFATEFGKRRRDEAANQADERTMAFFAENLA